MNLHTVEAGRLYRSGQPEDYRLSDWIERYGLRTVLRLRGGGPDEASYQNSHRPTVAADIAFVHVPMSAVQYPTAEQLLRLWEVFATADYPMLLHCNGGADRSGIASALYVLQRTGDLDLAKGQLALVPYLHTGLNGTDKLDHVLEMYTDHAERLSFPDWVRTRYAPPR